MANRKSSITAELKLAGQAQFKSGLAQIGAEGSKLGKTLREIKVISFDGGANQAKKAFELTEQHQRAHHRVLERQAKVNQARMEALGPMGGAGGGKAGRGNSYGLAVGYNAIQDLVQGGPAALANNIPQIIEMVAKSPMLKVLGVAAAAAAAGYGLVKVAQYAYSETDAGNEDISAKNYAKGRAEADRKKFEREKKEADTRSTAIAAAGRQNQESFGGVIDQEVGQITRNYQLGEGSAIVAEKLQRTKLKGIKDDEQRINALADQEKQAVQAAYDRNNRRINQILQVAVQEEASARRAYQENKAVLDGITKGALNPQDERIKEQAQQKEIGIQKRMKDAQDRLTQAQEDSNQVKQQGAEIDGRQAEIDEQRKNDLADLTDETKRLAAAEYERFSNEWDAEQKRQAAAKKKEEKAQKKAADEEKDRQSIRDRLTGEEELLNMSPRKRAKAERELKKTKDIEELQKKGFGPEEAASMAERGIKLEEANDPSRSRRIRGAGYGRDDASRDRRTTFSALEDLEAFQPVTGKERKTIKGAGNKDQDKKSGTNDKPESAADAIVQGLAKVEKAIREGNPNATERGRPTSSRTSTA